MKDNIIGFIGMALPGGFSVYSLIEDMNLILTFAGLVITLTIGITVLVINYKKIQKLNRDKRIDDIIFKHPNNTISK